MRKNSVAGISLLLLVGAAFGAEEGFPTVGSYGFDWLKPRSARCKRITEKDARKFTNCRYSRDYAFGLDLDAYSCRVDSRIEYILLKTSAQCKQALETMQANGP